MLLNFIGSSDFHLHLIKVTPSTMLLILCIEEANDGQWSIDEVTEKLRQSGGDNWKVEFKEVVNLEEKIFEENVCDKTPEEYVDYAARHDLTFLTPSGHQIRCKVNVGYIPCSGKNKFFRLAGISTSSDSQYTREKMKVMISCLGNNPFFKVSLRRLRPISGIKLDCILSNGYWIGRNK